MTQLIAVTLATGMSVCIGLWWVYHRAARKQQQKIQFLIERVQRLERRDSAAGHAAYGMGTELLKLQTSVAYSQRLLLNNIVRRGQPQIDAHEALPVSRDERNLRRLVPLTS